ncbi:hypothetical protein ACFV6E_38525 [Streptomyces sp. NPDC059785]|uniref:hypothetical protein n=1 Tax=unclassified Streptomyces TaxID=2593676 RepID=UPI0036579223
MDESGTPTQLAGAVQDLATEVVSALRSGDPFRLSGQVAHRDDTAPAADLTLAAVRVLGADVLLPNVLRRTPTDPDDLAVVSRAVHAFPPPGGASPASAWSHWALRTTLSRLDASLNGAPDAHTEPGADWLQDTSWQVLTRQLAALAALAVPGDDSAVTRAARARPVDVARGFVRAVRRRDWLQAAGAGRWLVLLDGVPDTLGLEGGLDFVAQMSGADARVALHLQAARLLRAGVPV